MWPREHGAYGQLAFPLLTAFAVAGVTAAGSLVAVAAAAAFVAHEPISVLLGRRGRRAQQDHGSKAQRWLGACAAIGAGAGIAALRLAPADARWAFWLPLLPAAIVAVMFAAGREKTAPGEVAVAVAFSTMAIPVCVGAGAAPATGLSITAAFGILFAASTLGVRVVILKVRGGGNPQAVRATRILLFALLASAAAGAAVAYPAGDLSLVALLAAVPGVALSVALAVRPPAPARLRTVGWALVSISALTAVALILGLRGG